VNGSLPFDVAAGLVVVAAAGVVVGVLVLVFVVGWD
jgi:hypothetical protein